MSYRDDLDAAHARIAALEAELDEVMTRHERLLAEQLRLRSDDDALPTLNEHNRKTPPLDHALGEPAGVSCPWCRIMFGEVIEMWRAGPIRIAIWSAELDRVGMTDQSVRCPKCRYIGIRIPE